MTRVNLLSNGEVLRDSFLPRPFVGLLENLLTEAFSEKAVDFQPAVNVVERENKFELQIELPGLKKENIKVEVDGQKLMISGERQSETLSEKDKLHSQEIRYGHFSRSFTLPKNINQEAIGAEF